MSTMEKFAALKNELKTLREEIKEKSKIIFKEASAELFKQHPTLKEFSWTQYTPYFNDGDACNFGVHNDEISFTTDDGEEEYWSGGGHYSTKDGRYVHVPAGDTSHNRAGLSALEFLHHFDKDDYEALFGDHVRVVVTKDGVTAQECSHD